MAANGRTVQVSGDYNIKTGEGNTILLDTSGGGESTAGRVVVTGNLEVRGDTLTVEAENLNVKDNVIVLNYGDPGPGVTLGQSGIQVNRGDTSAAPVVGDALIIYEESNNTWNLSHGTPGFGSSYQYSRLRVTEILTDSDTTNSTTGRDGDLTLIGTGLGVVSVKGTLDYEDQVTDPDDIPNKAYVDRAIIENPTFQIVKDDSRIIVFDSDDTLDLSSFPIGPYPSQPSESELGLVIDDVRVAYFTKDFLRMPGLRIISDSPAGTDANASLSGNSVSENNNATIIRADTNLNLRLETSNSGKVVIQNAVSLEYTGIAFSNVSDTTIFWGGTPGAGTTGINFINNRTNGPLSYTEGELVSKDRALLFSMLF